jgi:hypothetical protein
VIEQYPIATTPKYNFPHTDMDTALPQQFTASSLHSLKRMQLEPFQLNHYTFQQIRSFECFEQTLRIEPKPLHLKPTHEKKEIAAVDTSTIKIGDTSKGVVVAVRGANVWKQNSKYRYVRLGPFIFHITEENKGEVYRSLENAYFSSLHNHQSAPSLLLIPTRLANLLERWMQKALSKTISDGLILFDGSLTSGTADTPTYRMREILDEAEKTGNVVLAFSKATNLRANGYLITDRLPSHKPPYLLQTAGLRPKPPLALLGEVYVSKLTKGSCAFRLDIDKQIPFELKIEAVQQLLGNDFFSQGYPETLRLAHILGTFTANEVLAMQHFVAQKYRLQIINRPDMHRLLFGPFGKGESRS